MPGLYFVPNLILFSYLFGSTESHPHFEPSDKQFHHLIVLEIHSWAVQLHSRPPVVPQQHRDEQPHDNHPKYSKACVEHKQNGCAGGTGHCHSRMPWQQAPTSGTQQRATGRSHTAVTIQHRVEKLQKENTKKSLLNSALRDKETNGTSPS